MQKQALSVAWIQRSGVAHSLKDLEKALPGVSSVGGMQIKEHIQSLVDESLIRVEKIGSGNWYWSFLSDEAIKKETALAKVEAERDRARKTVQEVKAKMEMEMEKRREEGEGEGEGDEEMLLEPSMDRGALNDVRAQLLGDVEGLGKELATHSDNDPVEVEKRRDRILLERATLEAMTDAICAMEGWFKTRFGGDKAQLATMKRMWYGDEFDDETEGLREN